MSCREEKYSFLCFVKYCNEKKEPSGIAVEVVLRPFRKRGADFSVWCTDAKYREAFLNIRTGLSERVVLVHIDHDAAAKPEESGRPLAMFVDASDYGWAATLTQRPAKAFLDVQLRWFAMERELYALWQGVVGHERYTKGF